MTDRWVVLGGWGVEPGVLRPLFGAESVYIDINRLIPHIVSDNRLLPDWRERCAAEISRIAGCSARMAGWSTGAIVALGCRELLRPDPLVLISATRSFCRSATQRHGTKLSLLDAMRQKLATDKSGVIHDFRIRCGFPDGIVPDAPGCPWSADELGAGLSALAALTVEKADCTMGTPPLFIHGRNDAVIPVAAGEEACAAAGGTFIAVDDAPHACFIDHLEPLRTFIDHYLKDQAP